MQKSEVSFLIEMDDRTKLEKSKTKNTITIVMELNGTRFLTISFCIHSVA